MNTLFLLFQEQPEQSNQHGPRRSSRLFDWPAHPNQHGAEKRRGRSFDARKRSRSGTTLKWTAHSRSLVPISCWINDEQTRQQRHKLHKNTGSEQTTSRGTGGVWAGSRPTCPGGLAAGGLLRSFSSCRHYWGKNRTVHAKTPRTSSGVTSPFARAVNWLLIDAVKSREQTPLFI